MFPHLKKIGLYFSILSYTYAASPAIENVSKYTTNIDLELKIQQEIVPFKELLRFLMHPPIKISSLTFLKHGFQLQAKLDMLARRAIQADELLKNLAVLETQKEKVDMYQLLLALTFRVDTLENMLAPGEELKGQRGARWMHIFNKTSSPQVEGIRSKVHAAGMTERSFAEQVERLIQERNNRAGHANVPLPRLVKEKTIEGALQIMDITEDEKAVETVKILVAPVRGLDFTTTTPVKKDNYHDRRSTFQR